MNREAATTPATSDDPGELLGDFALLSTADPGQAQKVMLARYGIEFDAPRSDRFFSSVNVAELPNLFLHYSRNTEPIDATVPANSFTSVVLCLRGAMSITCNAKTVTIAKGQACVSSQGYARQVSFQQDSEVLMLRIPRQMLDRTFASLTGYPPKSAIEFEPRLDRTDPRYQGFLDILLTLASRLDKAFAAWPQAAIEQLEQACVTSLLYLGDHNLRHLLDGAAPADVPRHLRLAEHFAEANADRDIGIQEMAQAAAVSISTLTRSFLKHRGCSPAAFVKRSRLARAKTLLETRAETTVVAVAQRCGFTNASRFGRDYQRAFGETPSQTLRRLRSQPDAGKL